MKKNSLAKKRSGNFTVVQNELIEHPRLTYKAKGIFMYLWSRANMSNWTYSMKDIVGQSKDGKDGVLSGIRELETHGFIERITIKASGSKFAGYKYVLDDTPSLGEVVQEGKSSTVDSENRGGLSVTANPPLSKKDITKEHSIVADKSDDDTPVFLETMLEAIEVAEYLSSKLTESIDNYKAPSISGLHKWAKNIDCAIRLDNRTKQQLIDAIDWIHDGAGHWWIGNIKSGKKLREQFDTLTAQRTPATQKVPIRTRVSEAFDTGKVFFAFKDMQNNNRSVHVCRWGDNGALYDYNRNVYIPKEQAKKMWGYIEKNFDTIVSNFKAKQKSKQRVTI